jgi:hypothetical protein
MLASLFDPEERAQSAGTALREELEYRLRQLPAMVRHFIRATDDDPFPSDMAQCIGPPSQSVVDGNGEGEGNGRAGAFSG